MRRNAMKTSLLIITLVLLSTVALAESTGDDYIVADGVTYFCHAMKTGLANTRIMTIDGNIVKVPNSSVQAYQLNGNQFELLPLVDRQGSTIDYAFMEFIATNNNSRLYRYCSNCRQYDPLNGDIAPINYIYRYYVVRNGCVELLSNENIAVEILSGFNVKVINDKISR
jgi:hypothetical protein